MIAPTLTPTLTGAERAAVGLAARRLHDAVLAVVANIASAHEVRTAS
jgi:hypothetical protein